MTNPATFKYFLVFFRTPPDFRAETDLSSLTSLVLCHSGRTNHVGDTSRPEGGLHIAHDQLYQTLHTANQVHHPDLHLRPPQADGVHDTSARTLDLTRLVSFCASVLGMPPRTLIAIWLGMLSAANFSSCSMERQVLSAHPVFQLSSEKTHEKESWSRTWYSISSSARLHRCWRACILTMSTTSMGFAPAWIFFSFSCTHADQVERPHS